MEDKIGPLISIAAKHFALPVDQKPGWVRYVWRIGIAIVMIGLTFLFVPPLFGILSIVIGLPLLYWANKPEQPSAENIFLIEAFHGGLSGFFFEIRGKRTIIMQSPYRYEYVYWESKTDSETCVYVFANMLDARDQRLVMAAKWPNFQAGSQAFKRIPDYPGEWFKELVLECELDSFLRFTMTVSRR